MKVSRILVFVAITCLMLIAGFVFERYMTALHTTSSDVKARMLAIETVLEYDNMLVSDLWHILNFMKKKKFSYFSIGKPTGEIILESGIAINEEGMRYKKYKVPVNKRGRREFLLTYYVDKRAIFFNTLERDKYYIITILIFLTFLLAIGPLWIYFQKKRDEDIFSIFADSTDHEKLQFLLERNRSIGQIGQRIIDLLKNKEKKEKEAADIMLENSKNAALAQLTRHLSHDVRRPLSQVKVILDAFDMFKSNPSRLEQAKSDVGRAISSVETMLAEVMDYSRETKLETSPKSMGGVLDYVIRQVAQGPSDVDISFHYDFNAEHKPLLDEERFSRVLANIIGNGIEAITILGNKKSGSIDITTKNHQKNGQSFIEIIIGNDGPLFPDGVESKLFESFFTSGKSKGTGLGLASAKKVVELHDGDIFARNKSREPGVEFIIRLPSSNVPEVIDLEVLPKHSKDVLASKENLKGVDALIKKMEGKVFKTILLEDETLYRAWVKNLIQGNDILQKSVVLYDATSVDEAMQLVKKEKPTHAIVDIDLGGSKDGYDFLSEVKDNTTLKSIVHSNRTLDEFRQKAKDLGANGFAPKPFPLSNLVEFFTGEKIQGEEKLGQGNTRKIYCCDDTQLIRDHLDFLFSSYLKEKPGAFEYELFENGERLIKRTQEVKPDLALTDLNMRETGGQLNGYDVIKEIKKISGRTKAYLLSNEPNQLSEGPTKKAGGDGVLEQPLDKDLLYLLLDKVLV